MAHLPRAGCPQKLKKRLVKEATKTPPRDLQALAAEIGETVHTVHVWVLKSKLCRRMAKRNPLLEKS